MKISVYAIYLARKYTQENALLEQPYIRDNAKLVRQIIHELADKTRERIYVARFVRWQIEDEPRPRQRGVSLPRTDDDDGLQGAPVPKPGPQPHMPGRDAVQLPEE